jgi:benzoyl-CoA reductase/2-hydroxyglutaryl-CoA dehydratase subunit BcrC/BadD/HgdB
LITTYVDSLLRAGRDVLEKSRDDGTKVVGYFPGGYVPEELIYAAGAIPVCLLSGGDARIADEALSLVPSVICPFARAQIGKMLLEKDPVYTSLDLLVVPSTCQHMKKIGDVCEYHEGPQVFKLGIPYERDKDFELEYYRDRLIALKERLETVTGTSITDSRLAEAIGIYNRLRGLLRELSQTRRTGGSQSVSALDFVRLNHASFHADPVATTNVLEAICAADRSEAADDRDASRPRLLLMGPNLALGDYDLLTMVSAAGADIVIEEVFEGIRDYWHSIETTGDPLEALADGYLLGKRPAAFMRGSMRARLQFALSLARDFDVSGVLWYQLLCCEFYDEEAYYFQTALGERGIPMLVVESDYHTLDSGPLRTRLAAFVETLRGGPLDA